MSLSTEDESTVDLRFHWLPFTVAYWAFAVIVAIALQDAWVLFGFWLANPLVLAAFLLLRMRGDPAAGSAPALRSCGCQPQERSDSRGVLLMPRESFVLLDVRPKGLEPPTS